ncbi:SGNH/GDSL hydrolase family protein [Aquimarina sp. M1]
MKTRLFKKMLFSGIFLLILLIVLEVILSLFQPFPDGFYTGTPESGFIWEINSDEIIGIQGNSEVAFDRLGARSISDFSKKANKIAVFGGSTTACFALSQQLTWTALLEKKLGDSYWVGNFGRPGTSSNHHVLQFKHILAKPELEDVKTALILQGGNDFVGYLVSPQRYVNSSGSQLKKIAFQHLPKKEYSFLQKLVLYKLIKKAKQSISFFFYHKKSLTTVANEIKLKRQQSELIEDLPMLTDGLDHYERNTQEIINLAKERGIQVIFITQPTMWKKNLEPEYEKLLLTSGSANSDDFYSTAALSTGMSVFNERLKTVCDRNNISYIDLDLPKTTESFYDDLHFNESGAELVADKVFQFISYENVLVLD